MKRLTCLTFAFFLTISLIACSSTASINTPVEADWNKHLDSSAEMVDKADLIVKAKIEKTTPELRYDTVFTIYTLSINKTYKGDADKKEKVNVLFTGGDLNGKHSNAPYEMPLPDKNGENIFFLEKTSEGHYLVLGGYQGIGQVKKDIIEFNKPNESISKDFDKKKLKDVEDTIDKMKKK